jgi:hypothetical protein
MLPTGNTSGKTNNAALIKTTKPKMLNMWLTSTKRATKSCSSVEQRTSMRHHTKAHIAYSR